MPPNCTICRLLIIIALFWQTPALAQSGFVHIQSENGQTFYVQWNGITYGSSATGYVMIPKLTVGEQTLVIGFPHSQYPEYLFTCTVTEKPRGFSLKLAVDNTFSLFDMVSFATIKGRQATQADKAALETEAARLAKANKPVDSLENVFRPLETKAAAGISKIFHKTTDEGTDLVYVVNNDGKADTVVIFIPAGEILPKKPTAIGQLRIHSTTDRASSATNDPTVFVLPRRFGPIVLSN